MFGMNQTQHGVYNYVIAAHLSLFGEICHFEMWGRSVLLRLEKGEKAMLWS